METKSEIRKRILEARGALTQDEVAAKSDAILQKVLKTPEYMEADNILLYADYNREVMTRGIFEDAILRKKRVYFPKSDQLTNTMAFYQTVSVKQLEKGFMGIPEPKENPQLSTMALAFACQIVEELPSEPHDIKMDKIVTEEIIYSFLRI